MLYKLDAVIKINIFLYLGNLPLHYGTMFITVAIGRHEPYYLFTQIFDLSKNDWSWGSWKIITLIN